MGNYQLFDHYRMMERQDIALAFNGSISDKLLIGMAEIIKIRLSDKEEEQKIIQKVFSIFVELAQNICRYSADKASRGIIVIEDHRDHYVVKAGNLIENSKIQRLTDKIDHINRLDRRDLRKFYNRQLKNFRKEGQIGGNVGLISIAREAENPISVMTDSAGKNKTFIEIAIMINRKEVG